jgi:CDP-paratose 2-epimerase
MKILITGGLGFIGINAVKYFSNNNEIHIIDNLSRKGNLFNYEEIKTNENVTMHIVDIRINNDVEKIIKKITPDVIIHLAGQVAVTTSIIDPRSDFEINTIGTFNILEAIRQFSPETILLYSSTNKVYGKFETDIIETPKKYEYKNILGINEQMPLDFHSPYGCSKGAADQYVRDYSRIYNLKSVVLRQSCIYGENQYGIEDQGWVAWLTICAKYNKKFTIFGDGKQVRDILHVNDLIQLYELLINNIELCKGEIFNVGGGNINSLSILELIDLLNIDVDFTFDSFRPGDQKIYVSDITKLNNMLKWSPKIDKSTGVKSLLNWISTQENTLKTLKLI